MSVTVVPLLLTRALAKLAVCCVYPWHLQVQHEAAAAPPPPEIKSFDEYSKQDKARPTGKLGAKGRIEHQRDEAPSSGMF